MKTWFEDGIAYVEMLGVTFLDFDISDISGKTTDELKKTAFDCGYCIWENRAYKMMTIPWEHTYRGDLFFEWENDCPYADEIQGAIDAVRNGTAKTTGVELAAAKDDRKFLDKNLVLYINELLNDKVQVCMYADIWDNYIDVKSKDEDALKDFIKKLDYALVGAGIRHSRPYYIDENYKRTLYVNSHPFEKVYMKGVA